MDAVSSQSQARKRPSGIMIVAVLWILTGIVRMSLGVQTLIIDFGLLPYLSSLFDPSAPEWFNYSIHEREWISYGLPAETVFSFSIVALGFLTVFTAYGLFTAKPWSYKSAFVVPVLAAIVDGAAAALYATAPAEQGIAGEIARARTSLFFSLALVNLVWIIVISIYLRKPNVKQYIIGSSPSPLPTFNRRIHLELHNRQRHTFHSSPQPRQHIHWPR